MLLVDQYFLKGDHYWKQVTKFSELSRGISKKNRHVFIVEFIRLITKFYFVCLEAKLPF